MSRHGFQNGSTRVSIGWDAPLASFFLQVWTGDGQDEDEPPAICLPRRRLYREPLLAFAGERATISMLGMGIGRRRHG